MQGLKRFWLWYWQSRCFAGVQLSQHEHRDASTAGGHLFITSEAAASSCKGEGNARPSLVQSVV